MLSGPTREALASAGLDAASVADLARRTLEEDLGGGVDVTSVATIPFDQEGTAAFVSRQPGVVAGIAVAMACLDTAADDDLVYELVRADGPVAAGESVLRVRGLQAPAPCQTKCSKDELLDPSWPRPNSRCGSEQAKNRWVRQRWHRYCESRSK